MLQWSRSTTKLQHSLVTQEVIKLLSLTKEMKKRKKSKCILVGVLFLQWSLLNSLKTRAKSLKWPYQLKKHSSKSMFKQLHPDIRIKAYSATVFYSTKWSCLLLTNVWLYWIWISKRSEEWRLKKFTSVQRRFKAASWAKTIASSLLSAWQL